MLTDLQRQLLIASPQSVNWTDIAAILDDLPWFLREVRRRRGVSRNYVAERLGVSHDKINRFEREESTLSLDTAIYLIRWIADPDVGTKAKVAS
jgi:DNA-binding XRE family transcriptional regulator